MKTTTAPHSLLVVYLTYPPTALQSRSCYLNSTNEGTMGLERLSNLLTTILVAGLRLNLNFIWLFSKSPNGPTSRNLADFHHAPSAPAFPSLGALTLLPLVSLLLHAHPTLCRIPRFFFLF